jgi:hypothetical protein
MTSPPDRLSIAKLWASLEPAVRTLSAHALYAHDWGATPTRREADSAVAAALRTREVSVRKMPVDKRADYLARAVRPGESLASSLLLALHLEHRRPMLAAFLDAVGIPHENGLISGDDEIGPLDAAAVGRAALALFERFPPDEVAVYLATLLAMDPDLWAALEPVLRERISP